MKEKIFVLLVSTALLIGVLSGCVGEEIEVNNAPVADFLDTSTDQDGNVVAWSWDFGDGNTSTEQNPTYVYATAATYNVTLTIKDDYGDTSSETKEIVIE